MNTAPFLTPSHVPTNQAFDLFLRIAFCFANRSAIVGTRRGYEISNPGRRGTEYGFEQFERRAVNMTRHAGRDNTAVMV